MFIFFFLFVDWVKKKKNQHRTAAIRGTKAAFLLHFPLLLGRWRGLIRAPCAWSQPPTTCVTSAAHNDSSHDSGVDHWSCRCSLSSNQCGDWSSLFLYLSGLQKKNMFIGGFNFQEIEKTNWKICAVNSQYSIKLEKISAHNIYCLLKYIKLFYCLTLITLKNMFFLVLIKKYLFLNEFLKKWR